MLKMTLMAVTPPLAFLLGFVPTYAILTLIGG